MDDEILEFGSVNTQNFQSLQNIGSVVQHSEGVSWRLCGVWPVTLELPGQELWPGVGQLPLGGCYSHTVLPAQGLYIGCSLCLECSSP